MVIKKKELLESLKMCMPGIESGSKVLQGADLFIFHNGNIFTYNDVISVSVPITQEGLLEEGVEGCVKADEFFRVISKFPADEVKFSVTEKGTWLLKCGKAKAEFTLLDFDFESRLKNIQPGNDWVDLSDDFVAGLGICKMNNNKTQISGIYFSGKNIVSTDGNQMNFYELNKSEVPDFWLSDSSANELLKFNKLVSMQIQGNWAHFMSDTNVIFSVKTLQSQNYPFERIKNILDTSNTDKAILHGKFPKELFSAIDRAVSFSMDISEHLAVRLTISKEKIEVSSERNSGKYHEKILWEDELKTEFEPIIVYIDASMMEFISQRTVEFYLLKGPVRNGKNLLRLLFVTESSKHLLSTLDSKSEE